MATAELKVRIEAEIERLKGGLDDAEKDITNFDKSASKIVTNFGKNTTSVFNLLAKSIAGALSVQAFVNFGREVFTATAQFEKFGAVLSSTLGSKALADLKLKEIQEFAEKTPFGINEITNSFIKLANQGFKPTGDQMRSLGDLAASTGKTFDQLADAILDASTGQFNKLKDFGVIAKESGNKVIFTFQGVETTVDKTTESIRKYVTELGKAEGVTGSMATMGDTLSGKLTSLGNSWNLMLTSIGQNTSGIFAGAIDIVGKAINLIEKYNKGLSLVDKFKLKEDYGLNFQQGSLKLSDVKGEVAAVESAQKSVQKYIQSVQEIAKTPEEFKSSMKALAVLGKEAVLGINNANLSKAIVQQYVDGIIAIKALAKEAGKPRATSDFIDPKGKGAGEKSQSDILAQLAIDLQKVANSVDITFGEGNKQKVSAFAKAIDELTTIGGDKTLISKLQQDLLSIDPAKIKAAGQTVGVTLTSGISEGFNAAIPVVAKDLSTKLKGGLTEWQSYVNNDLLPKVQQNFETFFNEILIRGKFSFDALGKAILNTLLSVVASDAARSVANLFTATEKGVAKKDVGGIFGATGIIGSLFAKKAIAGAVTTTAATTAAATGGTAAIVAPVAATGGALLPILAGIAAVAGIASLLKKRKVEPQPAFTTSNAISTSSSSNVDFGNGRVVFEISGVNLVGVLNRAGAKLQRFGP